MKIRKKEIIAYIIIFICMGIISVFILNQSVQVTNFKRVIGQGIISDYDCDKVIQKFYLLFLCWGFFLSIFQYLFFYFHKEVFEKKNKTFFGELKNELQERKRAIKYLKEVIVIAIANIFSCFIKSNILLYSLFIIILLIISISFYLIMKLDRKISFDFYLKLFINSLLIGFHISLILNFNLFIVQYFILLITVLIVILTQLNEEKCSYFVDSVLISTSLLPLLTTFYIEIVNILNQYKIFIGNPKIWYFLVIIFDFIILQIVINKLKTKRIILKNWRKYIYLILIIGIAFLSVQLQLENSYEADVFETANSSVLISDFFNYHSIPIVEHYGGHMLDGVVTGILYGLINRDNFGAIVSPYSVYITPIIAVLFYIIVKKVINEDSAFLFVLTFPFYNYVSYFGLGLIVCISIFSFIKNHSYIRAFVIWITVAVCVLYRLDLGFAYGVATFITLLLYIIIYNDIKSIKKLIISMCSIIIIGIGLWFSICIFKNINPIFRLKEFLLVSLSNQNWSYDGINCGIGWLDIYSYYILPFLVILGLIYIILRQKKCRNIDKEIWIILLILGFSYLSNFSRGAVRHSLVELRFDVVIWTAHLFLAILICQLFKSDCKVFIVVFAILVLTISPIYNDNSILDLAFKRINIIEKSWVDKDEDGLTYWKKIKEEKQTISRTKINTNLEEQVKLYKEVIDCLLQEDETYLDFVNRSFIYSLKNRKDPVYESQSILQLSGEWLQEEFIKQIEKDIDDIPIAFLPVKSQYVSLHLDDISNFYRYYKVSEFIYNNYIPLFQCGEFSVWVIPGRYGEMESKILNTESKYLKQEEIKFFDGEEYPILKKRDLLNEDFHLYNLQELPRIWGEYDNRKAVENKIVTDAVFEDGIYILNDKVKNKQFGNYLLLSINYENIENLKSQKYLVINMGIYEDGKFIPKYKYLINIKSGEHQYLIRISSDYYWYKDEINAIELEKNNDLKNVKMKILEGD